MPIPNQEALDALHHIESVEQQSATAYHYQKASPHLLLWGVIWMVGYAATYVRPQWPVIWPAVLVPGIVGSLWIEWRARAAHSQGLGWRYAATLLAVFLFIEALVAVFPPKSGAQMSAFFPILVAFWYAILGIWTHTTRIALLGLALGALTLGAYFWLPQYFLLWMAGVGGGALVLGGLWLRRI
jgi:hypothetical protein